MLSSSVLCGAQITLQSPFVPQEIRHQLNILQEQVIDLLEKSLQITDNVLIITNAEEGWVDLSAEKFMPRVLHILRRVQVISARTTYQKQFKDQPNMWKRAAFLDQLYNIIGGRTGSTHQYGNASIEPYSASAAEHPISVISFGDSECERSALMSLGQGYPVASPTDSFSGLGGFSGGNFTNPISTPAAVPSVPPVIMGHMLWLKSIKFAERPNSEQLRREIEMIGNNLAFIVTHRGPLDLMLQISTVQAEQGQHEQEKQSENEVQDVQQNQVLQSPSDTSPQQTPFKSTTPNPSSPPIENFAPLESPYTTPKRGNNSDNNNNNNNNKSAPIPPDSEQEQDSEQQSNEMIKERDVQPKINGNQSRGSMDKDGDMDQVIENVNQGGLIENNVDVNEVQEYHSPDGRVGKLFKDNKDEIGGVWGEITDQQLFDYDQDSDKKGRMMKDPE
ncbi:MAG: hypothetical protein EZS28_020560 [Streblomastix strix]|uniref:Uncharacterized protein n=1 Tax=Streblomastix strix TaxID=222440 RepID=A0A5J4VNP9_9EUKA|nr:MAG: hypothetical protein EZS28_020560 [Streblomastix strix]